MANQWKKFKLVTMGKEGVGKTSLVLSFTSESFREFVPSTIVASHFSHNIYLNNDQEITFDIWDTAGQERFQSLIPMYYRNADAAIVVYAINDIESFHYAKRRIKELREMSLKNIVIALAGNKLDLTNYRNIEFAEGKHYAEQNGLIFMETSAKTAVNVNDIFVKIGKILSLSEANNPETGIILNNIVQNPKKSCCLKK